MARVTRADVALTILSASVELGLVWWWWFRVPRDAAPSWSWRDGLPPRPLGGLTGSHEPGVETGSPP